MDLATAPAAAAPIHWSAPGAPLPPKLGELRSPIRQPEPLYVGPTAGAAPFASLDDAIAGANAIATSTSSAHNTLAITRTADGSGFEVHDVLQTVWNAGLVGMTRNRLERAYVTPYRNAGEPMFEGRRHQYGVRNRSVELTRTTVYVDRASRVDALVGPGWALVDGTVRDLPPSTSTQR